MNPTPAHAPHWPDLTLAQDDTASLQQVLAGYARTQLRTLLTIPTSAVQARVRPLLVATQKRVKHLARTDLSLALGVLQWPTHNVLTACIGRAVRSGDRRSLTPWTEELCLLTWLELARLNRLTGADLTWSLRAGGPHLRNIAANVHVLATDETLPVRISDNALRVADQEVRLDEVDAALPEIAGAVLNRAYPVIVPGVVFALTDNNPLSDFEAHPDKDGNTLDLGAHSPAEWVDMLRACFALVDTQMPLLGQELRLVARQVVPVGFDPESHLSASYKESIGTAYMSLHPNEMTMAEALIHEFQHNKLNAASWLDPLLQNAFEPLFASPVRPDPRPLWGVLLAVHAFQPVAELYRVMRSNGHENAENPSFTRRFQQIVAKNHEGATTIRAHAKPTVIGAQLVAEMTQLDDAFAPFRLEPAIPRGESKARVQPDALRPLENPPS